MKNKQGKESEFHSKKCFELYQLAISYAMKVNYYLDNGYMVFIDNKRFTNKFVFYDNHYKKPFVAEKAGNSYLVYVGNSLDDNGKVWINGDETKQSIKKIFSKFRIVNPSDIKKINLE